MKIIAITQRVDIIESRNETRDSLDHRMIQFIEECGYLTILVPNNTKYLQDWIIKIDPHGFILSGGNNLNEFKSRDEIERSLIEHAKIHKKP